ncbi:uncharacterized protein LOC144539838 [Centroberyx gerrardi]
MLDSNDPAVFIAANIDEALLHTLTRDDLRDLFPGPEHFLRRKRVWALISPEVKKSPRKTLQLPSPPEYVIYTDSELEQARKHYFEMARTGREGECVMSKELRCRLVRNTVTSMISILRASLQGEEVRYPSKHELTAMAKRVVEYYPMLQDKEKPVKHMSIYGDTGEDYDADSSGASTVLLDQSPGTSSDDNHSTSDKDSLPAQARRYKTLQEMYKKQKPNQDAVSQLLDLEFEARRTFIDSDALKEEDRPTKILDAYPCFKDLMYVMDELRRILDKGNRKYIAEVKKRWEDFCSKVQFCAWSLTVSNIPTTFTIPTALTISTTLTATNSVYISTTSTSTYPTTTTPPALPSTA